jgi:hypothetical protein
MGQSIGDAMTSNFRNVAAGKSVAYAAPAVRAEAQVVTIDSQQDDAPAVRITAENEGRRPTVVTRGRQARRRRFDGRCRTGGRTTDEQLVKQSPHRRADV